MFDHLLLSNVKSIVEKQLVKTGFIADIVSVSQNYQEAHLAVKSMNKKNKIPSTYSINTKNEEIINNIPENLFRKGPAK